MNNNLLPAFLLVILPGIASCTEIEPFCRETTVEMASEKMKPCLTVSFDRCATKADKDLGSGLLYFFNSSGNLVAEPVEMDNANPYSCNLPAGTYRIWAVFNYNEQCGKEFREDLLQIRSVRELKSVRVPMKNQERRGQTVFLNVNGNDSPLKVSAGETLRVCLSGKPFMSKIVIDRIVNHLNYDNAGALDCYDVEFGGSYLTENIPLFQTFDNLPSPEYFHERDWPDPYDYGEVYCNWETQTVPQNGSVSRRDDRYAIYLLPNPDVSHKTVLYMKYRVEGGYNGEKEKGGWLYQGIVLPAMQGGCEYSINELEINNARGVVRCDVFTMGWSLSPTGSPLVSEINLETGFSFMKVYPVVLKSSPVVAATLFSCPITTTSAGKRFGVAFDGFISSTEASTEGVTLSEDVLSDGYFELTASYMHPSSGHVYSSPLTIRVADTSDWNRNDEPRTEGEVENEYY